MKLALLALLALLVGGSFACHATTSRSAEGDRAAVVRLARARSGALVARDVGALTAILDERFVYTNASGEVLDRATYLDRYLRSPDVRWHAQDLEDIDVRFHGETAILTGRVHDRATFGDQTLDAWFRSTFVYVKTAQGWRCVAGHSSSYIGRTAMHISQRTTPVEKSMQSPR